MSAPAVSPAPRRRAPLSATVQAIAEEVAVVRAAIAEAATVRIVEPEPEIFEVLEQGSPEWLLARAGIATASEFSALFSKGRKIADSKGGGFAPSAVRQTYIRKKALERIVGYPEPSFETPATRRGHEVEELLFRDYSFTSPDPVRRCGFMRRGSVGYSPDALVGDRGLAEFKSKSWGPGIPGVLDDEALEEHRVQCEVGMYVSGRDWCELVVSVQGLRSVEFLIERDQARMAEIHEAALSFELDVEAAIHEFEERFGVPRAELAIGAVW